VSTLDASRVYRAPLEDFVAERDRLVEELKADGRGEDAAAVAKLRKPTVPAWAIDQVPDRDPAAIEAVLDAGAEVRAAQQAALSSRSGADRLRAATAARREAIARVAAVAERALRDAGRDPTAHHDAIAATVEAASADPSLGERLRAGTLDKPVAATGGLADVLGLRVAPQPADEDDGTDDAPRPSTPTAGELGRLRRDRDAADRAATRAREAERTLAGRVTAAETHLDELRERHAKSEAAALEAETNAARARQALERASGGPKRRAGR